MTSPYHRQSLARRITAARRGDLDSAPPLQRKAAREAATDEAVRLWIADFAGSEVEATGSLQKAQVTDRTTWKTEERMKPSQDRVDEGWSCPFCHTGSPVKKIRCTCCGALLLANDLEAFRRNSGLDRHCLKQAVRRLEQGTPGSDSCQRLRDLALAKLNLGHFEAGLQCLEQASRIRPSDVLLKTRTKNLRAELTSSAKAAFTREREEAKAYPSSAPSRPELPETAELFPIRDSRPIHSAKGAERADTGPSSSTVPAAPVTKKPRRRFILLVDDSPTIRKLVTLALEQEGYAVLVASDGMEALSKVYEFTPDLILLDITMPNLDGFQLCTVIKANEKTSQTPVVMFTSKGSFMDKARGRQLGAVDHIVKPVDPTTLNRVLRKHLGLSEGEPS